MRAARALVALIAGWAWAVGACAAGPTVRLNVGDVTAAWGRLLGVQVNLPVWGDGPGVVSADSLRIAGHDLGAVSVTCAQLRFFQKQIHCPRGQLQIRLPHRQKSLRWPVAFQFDGVKGVFNLSATPAKGEQVRLTGQRVGAQWALNGTFGLGLARLAGVVPEMSAWQPTGFVAGALSLSHDAIAVTASVRQAGFSDASGAHAAEKIAATLKLNARQTEATWRGEASVRWESGAAFLDPLYLAPAKPVSLALQGEWARGELFISEARLDAGDLGHWQGGARWVPFGALQSAWFESGPVDLAVAAPVVVAPFVAQATPMPLTWAGKVRVSGSVRDGAWQQASVSLDEVSVRESAGQFAIEGVNAQLPWRADAAVEGQLEVAQLAWGALSAGPLKTTITVQPRGFVAPPIELPVADGALVVDALEAQHTPSGWRGALSLAVKPVSMSRLAAALGWPPMSGVVAASIPRVRHEAGVVVLDGALVVTAFGGFASVKGLQWVDPFGRVPRLFADVEVRNVDLGQLTEAFQFGSMTGRVDGDIRGLEWALGHPVSFSARVASSAGDYPKRISQRAVENLTALGGGGAQVALQRGFLGLFREFGYQRIGVSCVLKNGVCHMEGLGDVPGGGFLMIQGGGVPSLNVVGYNRAVDWAVLIERLKRVTARAAPTPLINKETP